MKTLTRTSMVVIAAAGLLALMAGAAMAAQPDMVMEQQGWNDGGVVDQFSEIDDRVIDEVKPLTQQPGDSGPDTPGDDGGQDTPGDDGGQDTPGMDGGDDGGQDTPGMDGGDSGTPPVNDDSGGETSTSELPNTGTSLTLLVALALVIATIAFVVRRAAGKRMH